MHYTELKYEKRKVGSVASKLATGSIQKTFRRCMHLNHCYCELKTAECFSFSFSSKQKPSQTYRLRKPTFFSARVNV